VESVATNPSLFKVTRQGCHSRKTGQAFVKRGVKARYLKHFGKALPHRRYTGEISRLMQWSKWNIAPQFCIYIWGCNHSGIERTAMNHPVSGSYWLTPAKMIGYDVKYDRKNLSKAGTGDFVIDHSLCRQSDDFEMPRPMTIPLKLSGKSANKCGIALEHSKLQAG
jgi:hypothetical protein